MNTSRNKNVVELHGCIVCAKLFNILVVYTPEGKLLAVKILSGDFHEGEIIRVESSNGKLEFTSLVSDQAVVS